MLSNPHVVNICLGINQDMFRFSPEKLHDIYARHNTLCVELNVESFMVLYEFDYVDNGELIKDIQTIEGYLVKQGC